MLTVFVLNSCKKGDNLTKEIYTNRTIDHTISPMVLDEIKTMKVSIDGCYVGNQIRYQNEYDMSECFIHIANELNQNDIITQETNDRIDSLSQRYLTETYKDDFAESYLKRNIYALNIDDIENESLSNLLVLYKIRNCMFILYENVCTSELDSNQKLHYLNDLNG